MSLLYILNRITRIVGWVLVKEIDEDTKIVIRKYWDKANKHPLSLTKKRFYFSPVIISIMKDYFYFALLEFSFSNKGLRSLLAFHTEINSITKKRSTHVSFLFNWTQVWREE